VFRKGGVGGTEFSLLALMTLVTTTSMLLDSSLDIDGCCLGDTAVAAGDGCLDEACSGRCVAAGGDCIILSLLGLAWLSD
jgi:hypothetical protein